MAHLKQHQQADAGEFGGDAAFRWAVREALDAKDLGKAKLRLWLESANRAAVAGMGLEEAGRLWAAHQQHLLASLGGEERVGLALEMCRSIGLFRREV